MPDVPDTTTTDNSRTNLITNPHSKLVRVFEFSLYHLTYSPTVESNLIDIPENVEVCNDNNL